MDKKQPAAPWGLSQGLMAKSLELAFEDPAMALRLADLAIRASLYLRERIDPYAAHEAFHRNRWRKDETPPAPVPNPKRNRSKAKRPPVSR